MDRNIFFIVVLVLVSLASAQYTSGSSCCANNQIEVSGEGKSSAIADVAIVNLGFDEKGLTSADAVQSLSKKVNQALAILKSNGIGGDNISTGSLNVYPEYNYQNGKNQVVGQRATQSIAVTIRNLDSKGQKVGTLVDALSQVNGIKIDSVTFDIFDKKQLQTQARAAAFKQAAAKAKDFAQAAGLFLGRVIKISDSQTVQAPPIALAFKSAMAADGAASFSTSVPVGSLDVSYSTVVTFDLRA